MRPTHISPPDSPSRGKERLDRILVERGLAATREKAQALVLAGLVRVEGKGVVKPGTIISLASKVEVSGADHPYVSRGGVKLADALEALGVPVKGKVCADIGASTGGFTHCLLLRGAVRVYAIDVGKGQIDQRLRKDPRVVVREGINARYLTPGDLPELFDLATVDVSFISLEKVLPAVGRLMAEQGEILALVKPQFEVGRGQVGKGGVVRDPALHRSVLVRVVHSAQAMGFGLLGVAPSPIRGPRGNAEFFCWLRRGEALADEPRLEQLVDQAVTAAHQMEGV